MFETAAERDWMSGWVVNAPVPSNWRETNKARNNVAKTDFMVIIFEWFGNMEEWTDHSQFSLSVKTVNCKLTVNVKRRNRNALGLEL